VRAARVPVSGRKRVATFIAAVAPRFWKGVTLAWIEITDKQPRSCHGWRSCCSRDSRRIGKRHRSNHVDYETKQTRRDHKSGQVLATATRRAQRLPR